jgi:hypothetical protein
MGNQVLYPHMQNYAYGDRRTHTGIPVCILAGITKIFAYGDPRSHNEIVRILGATYMSMKKKQMCVAFHAYLSGVTHMRQEITVLEIKSHFSIVCRFYLFSLLFIPGFFILEYFPNNSSASGLTKLTSPR